jgi:hypothetical protein
VPEQPDASRPAEWQQLKAEGSQERLADRVSGKLRQNGLLATTYGARNVRMDLDGPLRSVWDRGHVSMGDLWSYYRRYPYLTRLRDRSVLEQALRSVLDEFTWEHEGFALAEGFDESAASYRGVTIPHKGGFGPITDATLVLLPSIALEQQEPAEPNKDDEAGPSVVDGAPPIRGTTLVDQPAPPANVRFYGVTHINPERYGRDFSQIAQEVLQHLAAEGIDLSVTVEINATKRDGFADDKVRTILENAKTLKFDQYGFENK